MNPCAATESNRCATVLRTQRPRGDLVTRDQPPLTLDANWRLRAPGVTPRDMIDCMLASVAHRNTTRLLACDSDLERGAQVVGTPLDSTSAC